MGAASRTSTNADGVSCDSAKKAPCVSEARATAPRASGTFNAVAAPALWRAPHPMWGVGGGWPSLERTVLLLGGKRRAGDGALSAPRDAAASELFTDAQLQDIFGNPVNLLNPPMRHHRKSQAAQPIEPPLRARKKAST